MRMHTYKYTHAITHIIHTTPTLYTTITYPHMYKHTTNLIYTCVLARKYRLVYIQLIIPNVTLITEICKYKCITYGIIFDGMNIGLYKS